MILDQLFIRHLGIRLFYLAFLLASGPMNGQDLYYKNFRTEDGLPSTVVYDVFQDSKGLIWFGTNMGVSRYDGYEFINYTTDQGLSDNEIFTIHEDAQNRLWFLTFNGKLSFYDREKFYNPENTPFLRSAIVPSYLSNFSEDSQGNIYISSSNHNTFVLSPDQSIKKFDVRVIGHHFSWVNSRDDVFVTTASRVYRKLEDSLVMTQYISGISTTNLWSQEEDDIICNASENKLSIIDGLTGKLLFFHEFKDLDNEIIRAYRKDNHIWLGTRDGVIKLTFADLQFKNFHQKTYLKGEVVTGILEDREGNLWFSTLGSGVYFTPSPHITFSQTRHGLPDNRILCVSADYQNRLWIGYTKNRYSVLDQGQLSNYQLPSPQKSEVSSIIHFSPRETWVAGKSISLKIMDGKEQYVSAIGTDIIKDNYGHYWFGMRQTFRIPKEGIPKLILDAKVVDQEIKLGTYRRNIRSNSTFSIPIRTLALCEDGPGRLLLGSTVGLIRCNFDSTQVHPQTKSLLPYKIVDIAYDSLRGISWIATGAKGLFILKGDSLVSSITAADGLPSNICTRVY
ncbi:MAG: two-component regulator propeller domain-containing protein, partial [Bacteroidota bacterium]